jgi:hypothetical protein
MPHFNKHTGCGTVLYITHVLFLIKESGTRTQSVPKVPSASAVDKIQIIID